MNPWVSIWLHPRQTIREVLARGWGRYAIWIAAAAGAANMVMMVMVTSYSVGKAAAEVLGIAIAGAIWGVIVLYLVGWILRWVGGWLGGKASTADVRAALAWVDVTTLYIFVFWLVVVAATGGRVDTGMGVLFLVVFVVVIWAFVLKCHTLAEVHQFSVWKGLGTQLILSTLLGIPLMVAIALPNVLRGRMQANQSAAIGNLRSIISSLEMYRAQGDHYPDAWQAAMYPTGKEPLGTPSFNADLSDGHVVQAYRYRYEAMPKGCRASACTGYQVTALPVSSAGWNDLDPAFLAEADGLIHHCSGQAGVTPQSPTIDQPVVPCPRM